MGRTNGGERNANDEDDPLHGMRIEELSAEQLQQLADLVYEKLQRELSIERDRMGIHPPSYDWPA